MAARQVYERPGTVTHGVAVGEGARRCTQRHGAVCSAFCKPWKVDCFIYLRKDRPRRRVFTVFCRLELNAHFSALLQDGFLYSESCNVLRCLDISALVFTFNSA